MSESMTSVFLDRASVDQGDLDFRALDAELPNMASFDGTPAGLTRERIADAEVVISNKVVVDADAIAASPRLKLVVVAATGTNNVDLDAAARHGIAVCNVRDYATSSVAQHVFALVLALARSIGPYGAAVKDGRWNQSPFFCLLDYPIVDLEGLTLGIVGRGVLGSAVARLGEAFGMKILVGARPGAPTANGRVALPELFATADVISLHCPLTDETRGLVGREELALMKPTAIVINTARGGIVDEAALLDALAAGEIGGAGIDVLGTEPPDGSSALTAADLPNLIVTPHIAWASRRCRQNLVDQMTEIVRAFKRGEAVNRVA